MRPRDFQGAIAVRNACPRPYSDKVNRQMDDERPQPLNYASPQAKRRPEPRSVRAISVHIGLWYALGAAGVWVLVEQVSEAQFGDAVLTAMIMLVIRRLVIQPLIRERREAIVRERHLCPSCGKFLLSESFRFCPACGKPVPGRR